MLSTRVQIVLPIHAAYIYFDDKVGQELQSYIKTLLRAM